MSGQSGLLQGIWSNTYLKRRMHSSEPISSSHLQVILCPQGGVLYCQREAANKLERRIRFSSSTSVPSPANCKCGCLRCPNRSIIRSKLFLRTRKINWKKMKLSAFEFIELWRIQCVLLWLCRRGHREILLAVELCVIPCQATPPWFSSQRKSPKPASGNL